MEEAHDAQASVSYDWAKKSRLLSEESHVRPSWLPTYLPTSDFILRHDDSWRTLRTDKRVIEQTNNKNEIIQ